MTQYNRVGNSIRFLSLVLIIFLSACAQLSSNGNEPAKRSSDKALSFTYKCDSGKSITVLYPTANTAVLHYDNYRLSMHSAVSASGARYVDERLAWWVKGVNEGAAGTLFKRLEDDASNEIIEQCTQVADVE